MGRWKILIDLIPFFFQGFEMPMFHLMFHPFWGVGWEFYLFCWETIFFRFHLSGGAYLPLQELCGNRFQPGKGAIESCSLLSALMQWMDYEHRCICTSHFHLYIHLAFGSRIEAYFILCRALSSIINKTRDLS